MTTLLDGGMGQELIRRGSPRSAEFWSAWAMIEDPDLVRGVHAALGEPKQADAGAQFVSAAAKVEPAGQRKEELAECATQELEGLAEEGEEEVAGLVEGEVDAVEEVILVAE